MLNRNRQRGFTLIELLIVVAIIGIIAAILIPNLLDALQKAKQKRTVADMRNTGTAWMSWLTDQVGAASAGAQKQYPGSNHNAKTYQEVFGYLNPSASFFYMQEVPEIDGWNFAYQFAQHSDVVRSSVLMMCSGGRGGVLGENAAGVATCAATWTVAPFTSTDYDQDIAWADGYFLAWPN